MKITIYGAGYVGLVSACCFASLGHEVLCVEIDPEKLSQLEQGQCPIYEPGLADLLLQGIENKRLSFTASYEKGIDFAVPQFIAVGTPSGENGRVNMEYVNQVVVNIASHISDFRVVISKSTVPVGTAMMIQRLIDEGLNKRQLSLDYAVASNPEFLREGRAVDDFLKPDRIIIGSQHPKAKAILEAIYEPLDAKRIHMSLSSAELTKYAANTLLATKVSFINEISQIAERYGADITQICQGLASDHRIGEHYIEPGCGYGGSCFPKDVSALAHMAEQVDYQAELTQAVQSVNAKQKRVLWDKMAQHFNSTDFTGKRIGVWGLAFKPNTDDVRESPSIVMLEQLLAANAEVLVYDPEAMSRFKHDVAFADKLIYAESAGSVLDGIDALVILTAWDEFKNETLLKTLACKTVFDGRNLFTPSRMRKLGLNYYSIGRCE